MNLPKWPYYDSNQIEIVKNVLESGNVNRWTGNETLKFEKEFCDFHGVKYGIALANGTLALTAAYTAIGLNQGDEIITTPRTFIATSSSAVMLGGNVIFADVDLNSGNITPQTIEPLISDKTKAISIVHLAGWPADMEEICNLAKKHNLKIIEDCSQAHGAKIDNKYVGSFGDIAIWSFCQDKIISTGGEGGMVTTNDKEYYEKIWSLKDHGKSLNALTNPQKKVGFKWLHHSFGTNYRLTELQSAMGRYQLKMLPTSLKKREENAMILFNTLKDIKALKIPLPNSNKTHAWYKFYAYLDINKLRNGWSRDKIIERIIDTGYPAFSGSCSEIYLEKCFINSNMRPKTNLTNAKKLGDISLMFLVHPTISRNEMKLYADTIKKIILKALN